MVKCIFGLRFISNQSNCAKEFMKEGNCILTIRNEKRIVIHDFLNTSLRKYK
jgi:hypothetical protein